MAKTRIQIAKPDINKHFAGLNTNVFKKRDIDKIFRQNRDYWRLTQNMTVNEFIQFLVKESNLKVAKFKFPNRSLVRYIWGSASIIEIIFTLRPNAYFSHYTAIFLNELTEQIPQNIYLNTEQKPKAITTTGMEQKRIDWAFGRPMRVTNNVTTFNNHKVFLLNGMYTGNLGINNIQTTDGANVQVTDIERTLIDITVRPLYAGGVYEILNAYKLAVDRISVNKLSAMLKKMSFTYPYHQAIGFYLEKSGCYKTSQVNLMRKFDFTYDFYLTHQMKEMSYSKKWRLYYPVGF
jgi:predicted transcriptional regulator of viral defense system